MHPPRPLLIDVSRPTRDIPVVTDDGEGSRAARHPGPCETRVTNVTEIHTLVRMGCSEGERIRNDAAVWKAVAFNLISCSVKVRNSIMTAVHSRSNNGPNVRPPSVMHQAVGCRAA